MIKQKIIQFPKRFGVTSALLALSTFAGITSMAASTAPLIQASDVTYLGGFALPTWANGATYGTSFFEYGGNGLYFYHDPGTGKRTLFMQGHVHYPGQVAQIQVPSNFVKSADVTALPMATVLQPFADITAPVGVPPSPTSCTGNPANITGLLVYNGKLNIGSSCQYAGSQTQSLGYPKGTQLTNSGFQGWFPFASSVTAVVPPRALTASMVAIPPEWQAQLGGPVLASARDLSVIGTDSDGPSVTAFNPDNVGPTPIPGTPLMYFPTSNPLCGAQNCEYTQNAVYNSTTGFIATAFPPGTRSVLVTEAHGSGCYWYGGPTANAIGGWAGPGTGNTGKGPHAPPYVYQLLAFDANDLLAVKNGTKAVYAPRPYAIIPLNGMPNSNDDYIFGATYDPETGQLFIAQDYGEQPRIEVYQIRRIGTPIPAPMPPANLKVQKIT